MGGAQQQRGGAGVVAVRLFAALKDAAGTGETTVAPGPLPDVLTRLRIRYGEPFTTRLEVATVLLDDEPVDPRSSVEVPPGASLALLPPFAGG